MEDAQVWDALKAENAELRDQLKKLETDYEATMKSIEESTATEHQKLEKAIADRDVKIKDQEERLERFRSEVEALKQERSAVDTHLLGNSLDLYLLSGLLMFQVFLVILTQFFSQALWTSEA